MFQFHAPSKFNLSSSSYSLHHIYNPGFKNVISSCEKLYLTEKITSTTVN